MIPHKRSDIQEGMVRIDIDKYMVKHKDAVYNNKSNI